MELSRIYQGEYGVYQKGAMYCFLKGDYEQSVIGLEDSFLKGGRYLFCPREAADGHVLSEKGIQYLRRWNRELLFLWVENPEENYFDWKVFKMENTDEVKNLAFGGYSLTINPWESLSVRNDTFLFVFPGTGNYSLSTGKIRLLGDTRELELHTAGEECGTFKGAFSVREDACEDLMERLDAGIRHARIMEEQEELAKEQGFLSQAVSRVLIPETTFYTEFKITPQALLDTKRTRLSLAGSSFQSFFTTHTGRAVKLKAEEDSALVFQRKPVLAYKNKKGEVVTRKRLYLGIEGNFSVDREVRKLLCGLSGTENIGLQEGAMIQFTPSMPAVFPYEEEKTILGTTSWIGVLGEAFYYCQPEGAALFAAPENKRLCFLEIPAATFPNKMPAVPMTLFREIHMESWEDRDVLEKGLYEKRREILKKKASERGGLWTESMRGVTPQSLMVQVSPKGEYEWIGLADLSGTGTLPDLRFTHIYSELREKFQHKEFLYAIQDSGEFDKAGPSDGFCFLVEGIRFLLLPDYWRGQHTGSRTMIFLKYAGEKSIEEDQRENLSFRETAKNAYTEDGEVKEGWEEFIEAAGDKKFQGILAVNVSVSMEELPPEIGVIMESVETDQFYASYLVIRAGQIHREEQKGIYLEQSEISGLIDYTSDKKLVYESMPPDYDYLTREIRVRIQAGHIVSFTSSSEILVNRLFEVSAVSEGNTDGNCLILQGQMAEEDGVRKYQYHLKQSVCYALSGSGIEKVWIQKMNLTVGEEGEGCFDLTGVFSCRELREADLLGYGGQGAEEGMPFYQLFIRMPKSGPMNMEYSHLGYIREEASLRENSFPEKFAVSFDSLIVETSGRTPQEKGFLPITAPLSQGVPPECYQGLLWRIQLGSLGALADQDMISIQLLTAFWEEDGMPQYYVGVNLPGALSGEGVKLQGIFQLGFGSITLEKQENQYVFRLHNFQIKVLGASFPKGSSDIFLFSDGKNVGWYAAYQREET